MRALAAIIWLWASVATATVTGTLTNVSYTCNGTQTVLPVPFKFLADGDLQVHVVSPLSDTILTLTTQYSVVGAGNDSGTVTLTSGALCPAGYTLRINRVTPRSQPTSFRTQGVFSPKAHEAAFDRAILIAQELAAEVDVTSLQSPASKDYVQTYLQGILGGGPAIVPATWALTGDGAATGFAIAGATVNSASLYVVTIDGVQQQPTTDYTVSGSQITFAVAPPLGSKITVECFGYALGTSIGDTTTVQAAGSNNPRSLASRAADEVNLLDFAGADPTGATPSTGALRSAASRASATGAELVIPPGTYTLVPDLAATDEAGPISVAVLMASNLRVRGYGATLRIADNISTDAAPRRMAMWFTGVPLAHVEFRGITFDMNGQHNPISPSRPSSYNRWTQAPILVSGTPDAANHVAARIDDAVIEDCTFINGPGASYIVMAQSNTSGVILGKRWTIRNNNFLNGGLDTDDHSSIYGWAEDVQCEGNQFSSDTMQGTVGHTGGLVAYEVHGARVSFSANRVRNYYQGMWVGTNLSAPVDGVLISGNTFEVRGAGINFYREGATESTIDGVAILGNSITLTDLATDDPASVSYGVHAGASYAMTGVTVEGNTIRRSGAIVKGSIGIRVAAPLHAGDVTSGVVVRGNHISGTATGIDLKTYNTSVGGSLGAVAIVGNTLHNLTAAAPWYTTQVGVSAAEVVATGPVGQLAVADNITVDDRGASSQTDFGIYLSGAVSVLTVGTNLALGVTGAEYQESAFTATVRAGSKMYLADMPTSATGLPPGALWRDAAASNVVKLVP